MTDPESRKPHPVFCTYFDHHYLSRGLALYGSFIEHCKPFELHVLCLSPECFSFLTCVALPGIVPISLQELEMRVPRLGEAKTNRTLIEYYFTCSPLLPLFVLEKNPMASGVVYLDSDMFCFSDVSEILDRCSRWSVGLSPHRFPPRLKNEEIHGRFNVGFLWFRNDAVGKETLQWWGDRCIEWCYDRVESGRFADQKYLDQIPVLFPNVWEIDHPGIDLAPWNLEHETLHRESSHVRLRGGLPLLIHHFHGLKKRSFGFWDLGLKVYPHNVSKVLIECIFQPYLTSLAKWERWALEKGADTGCDHGIRYSLAKTIDWTPPWRRIPKRILDEMASLLFRTRTRHLVFAPSGKIWGRSSK